MFGNASKEDVREIVREHEERTMRLINDKFTDHKKDIERIDRQTVDNQTRIAVVETKQASNITYRILYSLVGGGVALAVGIMGLIDFVMRGGQ